MSESPSGAVGAEDARAKEPRSADGKRPGFFGRIALFVRQVVAELSKVVAPTRSELGTYFTVVLVFLVVMMAFITLLDWGVSRGVSWVFGA